MTHRIAHVLLVEDNPGDVDLVRESLEAGKVLVELSVVGDGEQAIAFLLKRPPFELAKKPDLILLALNLPKLSGREVLAEIRQHDHLRPVPVVVLTSSDAEQDVAKSYSLGANCYVTKPVGLDAFQSIVLTLNEFWFGIVKLP